MRNKLTIILSLLVALTLSIASCKKTPTRSETARTAAEQFYAYLQNGQYESFANCIYTPDSMPHEYRLQLAQATKQYIEMDTRNRGGLLDATVISDSVFNDSTEALVNIQLTFGDNTTEKTRMFLVFTADGWKMK